MTEADPAGRPPVSWTPEPPASGASGASFADFLSFRYLITPGFITVIYVIGALVITIGGLAASTGAAADVLRGLLIVVIANLWWRIVLEFVMVLFRINAALQSIDRRGRGM
jgi:hypothetical protein